MPNWWNLELDWPIADSTDEHSNLITLFENPIDVEISNCRIESVNGIKKLVIDVETSDPIDIFAIVHGLVDSSGVSDKYELTTDIFTTLWPYEIFRREVCSEVPVSWLNNWLLAKTIPKKIIYENIINVDPTPCRVRAGMKIGEMGNHPTDDSKKQIKISIGYADGEDSNPRFMHPREFFSLLFWMEECDPFYTNTPIDYDSPLLQKMMRLYDDGSPVVDESGTPVDDIGQLSNNDSDFCPFAGVDTWLNNNNVFRGHENIDEWLGLRPPLRTYKRVEWEARVTHKIHHNNWQSAPNSTSPPHGDLVNVIRNPLIRVGVALRTASKCNLFVGEMAFRSGFRVFVQRVGTHHLSYQSRNSFIRPCNAESCNDVTISASSTNTITHNGNSYRISGRKIRGKTRYVTDGNRGQINQEISNDGKVIIYARKRYCVGSGLSGSDLYPPYLPHGTLDLCSDRSSRPKSFHVVFISRISSVTPISVVANILDQHLMDPSSPNIPRNCGGGYCGCGDQNGRAFIELIPGGDPTEEWGEVDLNCLEEVP